MAWRLSPATIRAPHPCPQLCAAGGAVSSPPTRSATGTVKGLGSDWWNPSHLCHCLVRWQDGFPNHLPIPPLALELTGHLCFLIKPIGWGQLQFLADSHLAPNWRAVFWNTRQNTAVVHDSLNTRGAMARHQARGAPSLHFVWLFMSSVN